MALTKKQKEEARNEAIDALKNVRGIQAGDTLYTIVKHVSSSKMLRVIRVIQINGNEPFYISYRAAQALGWPYDEDKEGIRVSGCGMDMGFHTVYELSGALFKDGYALNQRWL